MQSSGIKDKMASAWESLYLTITGAEVPQAAGALLAEERWLQLLCAALLVTALLAAALLRPSAPPTPPALCVEAFARFYEDSVRQVFPSQAVETHAALVAGAHAALRPAAVARAAFPHRLLPAQPLVLLLAPPCAARTAMRLAQATAGAVAAALLGLKAPLAEGRAVEGLTVGGTALAAAAAALGATEAGAGAAGEEGAALIATAALSAAGARWRAAVLTDAEQLPPAAAARALLSYASSFAPLPRPVTCPPPTPAVSPPPPPPLWHRSQPQMLLVVVMDVGERFTSEQLRLQQPSAIADTLLQDLWGERLDPTTLWQLRTLLAPRAALVREEDSRAPSPVPTPAPSPTPTPAPASPPVQVPVPCLPVNVQGARTHSSLPVPFHPPGTSPSEGSAPLTHVTSAALPLDPL